MSSFLKGRSKRERVMLAMFAVVVVLGGAMKVMASGGSAVAVDDGTPHAPVDATSVPPVVDDPVVDEGEAVEHPKGPGSKRDPFDPNIRVGSGDSTGGTTVPDQPGTEEPSGQVTVQLEDVYPDAQGRLVAQIKLDGTRFRVREGATAADLVTVIQLTERCGTFEQGGGTFALCVGQAIQRAR